MVEAVNLGGSGPLQTLSYIHTKYHPRLAVYLNSLSATGLNLSIYRIDRLCQLFDGLYTDGLITENAAVQSGDIIKFARAFPMPHDIGATIDQILLPLWTIPGATGVNHGYDASDYTVNGLATTGSSDRYDCGFTPADVTTATSAHIYLYTPSFATPTASNAYRIVGISGNPQTCLYYSHVNNTGTYSDGGFGHVKQSTSEAYWSGLPSDWIAGSKYSILGNRLNTTVSFVVNGTVRQSQETSDTTAPLSSYNFTFGNFIRLTNPTAFNCPVIDPMGWESCGLGMTPTQYANLRSRVETYNASIGR